MSEALPNRQAIRNGPAVLHRVPHAAVNGHGAAAEQDILRKEALLREERHRPREEDSDLLEGLGSELRPDAAQQTADEIEQIRLENAELRCAVTELRQLVTEAQPSGGKGWEDREKEYESLLEEKSDLIRELHLKNQDLQEKVSKAHVPVPHEEELQALSDELEQDRARLDVDRRQMEQERAQLREDEEELMKQMRDMEMSMSRERAELARQRNELQRLHADVQHALELAARDASLRDRLGPLQRRHQDINARKGTLPPAESRGPAPAAPAAGAAAASPPAKKESGLFRRLFGNGQ